MIYKDCNTKNLLKYKVMEGYPYPRLNHNILIFLVFHILSSNNCLVDRGLIGDNIMVNGFYHL